MSRLRHLRAIAAVTFNDTPMNQTLLRDLARDAFFRQQGTVVLVAGEPDAALFRRL